MEAAILSFLAAVLVGVVTTSTNVVLQRRRERQAQAGWESDQRYPAYVGLMAAATEFSALITNHESLLARRSRLRPWEALIYMRVSRHLERLHSAWASLVRHLAEVRLVGSPPVVARAEQLLEVVGESFQRVTLAGASQRDPGRRDHSPLIYDSITDFRDACRLELGQELMERGSDKAPPNEHSRQRVA